MGYSELQQFVFMAVRYQMETFAFSEDRGLDLQFASEAKAKAFAQAATLKIQLSKQLEAEASDDGYKVAVVGRSVIIVEQEG